MRFESASSPEAPQPTSEATEKRRQALVETLQRVSTGDRDAFQRVYFLTSAKLFGICMRILENNAEAEEALQEAFIKIWQRAPAYDCARGSPITWLATVTRNEAIDRLRANRHNRVIASTDPSENPEGVMMTAIDLMKAAELHDQLEDCLHLLDVESQLAIRRAFFEGMTYQDLADDKGIALSTMKSRIRRALLQLRGFMQR